MNTPQASSLKLQAPRRRAATVLVAGAALVLSGCGTALKGTKISAADLRAVPVQVEIDGREYTLAASLWRDFQPVAPPDGQPLAAVLKVSPSDMMPLPTDLTIDHAWVLNGNKQWSAAVEQPGASVQSQATHLEQSVRGGPKWGPGIDVDVVVRLKQGKQTWLVRQAGVTIRRTD